jgi:hypothetical protein
LLTIRRVHVVVVINLAVLATGLVPIAAPAPASPRLDLAATFQAVEQSLMDAVGVGDRAIWARVMDERCVVTSEEGQVSSKKEFLEALRPLPPGLSGGIAVRDLTVQAFPSFAIVRYLADEWEQVFDQQVTTKYRTTDTFRLDGSDWKLIASHTAVVTTDPPAQPIDRRGLRGLTGVYRIGAEGWMFHVELRGATLYGGRDPAKLRPFIPLTPAAFVLRGSLGEWLFVVGADGRASRIVEVRKFEPLVWTRVGAEPGRVQ